MKSNGCFRQISYLFIAVAVLVLSALAADGFAAGQPMLMSTDGESSYNNSKASNLGYAVTTISLSSIVSSPVSYLNNFDVVWINPGLSSSGYDTLRTGVSAGGSLEQYVGGGGTLVICTAGNSGSQNDIAPGGVDYDRFITHNSEFIMMPSHPYITGAGYGGYTLTVSDFQNWSSTDHGQLQHLVLGTTVVLSNTDGPSFVEYVRGSGMVILNTLTFGWGGSGAKGRPQDNLINYAAFATAVSDDLSVMPYSGLISSGNVGGPFTPQCQTYTLSNIGSGSLNWTAGATQSWLSVTPQSGTLAAGASAAVDVCINAGAVFLELGVYTDTVTFSNTTSGVTQTRSAELTVRTPQAKLTASDGASSDYFGRSVSIDGDYAIVGAYYDDDKGSNSGSAYVFKRDGSNWLQQAKLTASDGSSGDYFGYSVSIDGDYAIVGAYNDDDKGGDSGSAYIFKRDGSNWLQQAKLTASDGYSSDYFGYSVSIDGDYAIIGAYRDDDKGSSSGSAYVFKRDGSSWIPQAKLTASDGYSSDYFGISVSIDGDYAIVGAYEDDDKGSNSGSAYVFKRDGVNWPEQAKLTASDGASSDYFGRSVSIDGDYAVIGAYGDDDKGSYSGSAYVFKRDGVNWPEQAKLTASDGSSSDEFGFSVSIDGDCAVVGAYQDDETKGSYSGSAYIFKRDGSNWLQHSKLTASDGYPNDYFGIFVSISGNLTIVGAYKDDDKGIDSGSAYVFGRSDPLAISAVIPPDDFNSVGFEGGPFDPNVKEYILTNRGTDTLDWTILTPSWLSVEPNVGTLPAGANDMVVVYTNADVNALDPNSYEGQLVFTNLTTGSSQTRQAKLQVKRVPGEIFITDSIGAPNDCNLPFGDIIVGFARTEHVTIANTNPVHYLIIDLAPPVPPFGGFSDEFPDTVLDPQKWIGKISVPTIDNVGIGEPSEPYSLRLNGEPDGGDAVESRVIDLSGFSSGVQLSYWYEQTGGGEHPDMGEDLIVEYWNGSSWTELERHLGDGPDMTSYVESVITLPAGALHANFRLRFRRAPGSTCNCDDWFVDDVAIALTDAVGISQGRGTNTSGQSTTPAVVGPADDFPLAQGFRLENTPNLPARIEASSSITFDVVFEPPASKDYNCTFAIYSDDLDEPQTPVKLTGRGIPDYLEIVPADANLEFSGHPGGPFIPTYGYYQLTNIGTVDLQWSAEPNMPWLDIEPNNGILSPGKSVSVTVTPNSEVDLLPRGYYLFDIRFTDAITTLEQLRPVILNVYTEPKVWENPHSFEVVVSQGDVVTGVLTIGNTGGSNLDFALSCYQTDYVPDSQQSPESPAEEQNDVNVAAENDYTIAADVPFAPGRLLVKFKQQPNAPEPNAARKELCLSNAGGGEVIREYGIVRGLSLVQLPGGTSVAEALVAYNNTAGIVYAQPDYELKALSAGQKIPNDPSFSLQWNMHNTAQTGGYNDADIDAPEAWDIDTGSGRIVVAVIDTGVDYTHPDLAANMWVNTAEKNGTPGVDDDGNGYIDDIYGYDFCTDGQPRDSDPLDDAGHGSHCSGIIGAAADDGVGVAGVCWNVQIMAVKFLNYNGYGWTSDAIDSIDYCVLMGADLMSNSWGGGAYDSALEDAITAAGDAGLLFVAAAGNGRFNDNDRSPHYPSSYPSDNVIAVLSTDYTDNLSDHSNYGATSVDIAAPGGDSDCTIYSCYKNGGYHYAYGTSMAAPHVSGACALIWSMCPSLSSSSVKDILMQTADPLPSLTGRCVSGGRLNIYNALVETQTLCTAAWLQCCPDSGAVPPNDTVEVEVVFNGERDPGTYRGQIALATNDPYEPEIIIPVTLDVERVDDYTEWFNPAQPLDPNDPNCNDIEGRTLTFRPDGSAGYYSLCTGEAAAFPIGPDGGTILSLGDDDYAILNLGDATINYYGTEYDTLYVGSNGYLTFVSGDTGHFETFENHFALPRISALFDDLDPSAGGTVSFKQLDDRIVVTFEDVPEYGWANRNSFQIEMRYNGKIRITFTDIDTYDGIVGLSKGCGISSCFAESDLSEYAVCNLAADFNGDLDIGLTDFAIFADLWRLQYENGGIETVRDEFGSGSYSGNDGTADFAGDWQESGESDGPSRGVIQVIDKHQVNSLRIGDRSKTVHPVICLTRQADLTDATSATLTYDYEVDDLGGVGAVSVQISADGGQTWDTLADYDYSAGAGSASFDVTAYACPDTMIRFETGSQLKMYLYVDNVQIEYYTEPWFYNCDLNQDFSIDCLDLAVFADNWLN